MSAIYKSGTFYAGGGSDLPSGGDAGQALLKRTSADQDVVWGDVSGVPDGGTTGQSLLKKSDQDGDVEWGDVDALPSGGTTGQFLKKKSDSDGDVEWDDVDALPSGGTTGQVLTKRSNTDGDVEWKTVDSIQLDVMPTANVSLIGKVVQFTGTTTVEYTHNFFYECVEDGSTYKWENTEVQFVDSIQKTTLPTPTADLQGTIYQFVGTSGGFVNGYFYECVEVEGTPGTYQWTQKAVQLGGHTVVNNGTELAARSKLNLIDLEATDDASNDATDVKPHLVTSAEFEDIFAMLPSSVPAAANRGFTPVGTVITVLGTTAPMNYLECDGTAYPIASYPVLAAYFETQFGSKNYFGGDGITTFAVPDLTGNTLTNAKFCVAFKNIYIETIPYDIYSTEERVVGEWIDGKPLYQKTVIFSSEKTLATGSNWQTIDTADNIAKIIDFQLYRNVGLFQVAQVTISSGNINIARGDQTINNTVNGIVGYTVLYTKTS